MDDLQKINFFIKVSLDIHRITAYIKNCFSIFFLYTRSRLSGRGDRYTRSE